MSHDRLLINGELRSPRQRLAVIDPSIAQVLAEAPLAAASDLRDAVVSARAAFDSGPWPRMSLQERKEFLSRIAAGILEQAGELAALETANTGKPIKESTFMDVPSAARAFSYLAEHLDEYLRQTNIETQEPFPSRSTLVREPLGVVGIIVPWNYPLLIACWKIASALAAGNTVVVKPSTLTPLTVLSLGEIIRAAGLPAGTVNIINARAEDAAAGLVSSELVDMISFTGSNDSGRQIAVRCASPVKKLLMELGGKSASIVTPDADFETAVNGTLCSCFLNQGQMCTQMSRVLVADSLYEDFVAALAQKARRIVLGRGSDVQTQMGPLISAAQRDRVHAAVVEAQRQGARAVCGGSLPDRGALGDGFFYPPTILTQVTPQMPLYRSEVFGPVVTVHPFSGEDEAVRMANDTLYGLAACIWSRDTERARAIASRLDAGTVWMNTYGMFLNELPYGGFKQSGFGKELGREGLWEYTRLKNIVADASPDKPLIHYWYGL